MNIVQKKTDEIKPYEKNPRKNDHAVKFVAASIEQFGFKVPIVIDKDGVIVAGHTRWKAAKKLGIEKVPCVVADDLSDEQIKAFRLADNKVSEKADWDFELLNEELDEIIDFDMSDFGFYDSYNEDEFDHLFESQAKPPEENKSEEETEEDNGWRVIITAESEDEALEIMEAIKELGYECEVSKQ